MKNMLLLIVMLMATLANVKAEETTGKPIKECEHKNNFTYTHHVRHETDCHKFYKCLGGYGFVIECPTLKGVHLVFNEKLQVCDWEGVSCSDESSTPTGSSPTETPTGSSSTDTSTSSSATRVPPPDCTVDPDRKKPHADCHKFWICNQGKPLERECGEGTNFNPIIAECDYYECKK